MAEDFQARIGASNWRNLSNSAFSGGPPPCLTGYSDIGSYGWSATRMFYEEPNSVSGISFDFPRAQKAQILDPASGGGSILIDSDSSTMGFSVSSSPTSDWNQILLSRRNGTSGFTRPSDFSTIVEDENSIACNIIKSVDQDFYAAEGCLSSDIRPGNDHNFSAGFPVRSASYGQASTLLQNLLNSQTQESPFPPNNRSSNSLSSADFGLNCDELSSAWPKVGSSYQKTSTSQHQNVGLCFSKNAPFWNSSSKKLQLYAGEDVQQPGLIAKRLNVGGGDLALKRPRIETPSPLPTFKVRKEKLGDRITALQQLVSPFGKTDTASVLHEAIEYIKFLHEQVSVLSTPYMKSGASDHHQKEPEEATQELRNRGLCLVPISSTFAAASETTPDFWTPTFGATLN